MNFRQVHLDFHTSGEIENIGSEFTRANFQKALKEGHVNSITLFAKCHHGWAYFPSETNVMHPHLAFDLLGEQIEAAHEIGVKTPVYLSAGLDERLARIHPDWLYRNPDQSTEWAHDFSVPGYHRICMNTPYLEILASEVEEVVRKYDCDGIFLDIVGAFPCRCLHCVQTMLDKGLDPYDDTNAYKNGVEVYKKYLARMRQAVDKYKPGLPLFHNAGHLQSGRRDFAGANTHLELESLPTGGWGYDHFQLSAAYARTLGMEYLGMTGKFHLSWGEFGGFKHPNALRYEVAIDMANGAKMSIGDQCHPLGKLESATYKLIGEAYADVEKKEPWLDGVESVADVALLSQEALFTYMHPGEIPPNKNSYFGATGASRMLIEGKYLFDVVDTEADLSKYKVLIITDDGVIDRQYAQKVHEFIDNGGKVLASGTSALLNDGSGFAFDLGARYLGKCEYCPAYIRPNFEMEGLYDSAYVIYNQAQSIEATGEVTAIRENPYFNRTTHHFSSHAQTPNDPAHRYPAITFGADGAYISFPLFTEYALKGSLIAKRVVEATLDRLLSDDKTLTTNLPSYGITTLMKQGNRYINHLIYVTPVKRGKGVEIVEDIIPVYNTEISIKLDTEPTRVYLAPQDRDIDYDYTDGVLTYTVDKIDCHQMVVIE
ncbi:MAG: beta-galactosidase [Clostridia bacterium]|nr:beta-galactosidase [Clostridia bacterium]